MDLRLSLFARLLIWFFGCLAVIGLVLLLLFNLQFRLPPDSPFRLNRGPRVLTVAHQIALDLGETSEDRRDEVLGRYSETYGVAFVLYSNAGRLLAGRRDGIPAEVLARVVGASGERGATTSSHTAAPVPPPSPQPAPHSPRPATVAFPEPALFTMHTPDPSRYWAGVRILVPAGPNRHPLPATLLAVSESITGHGLFFNLLPWLLVALVVVALATLLWLPMARSITRPIYGLTAAAERIARGQFDVRVDAHRSDEIGRLGAAVNDMSARLDDHVKSQKRFLGDVAHELASPIARIRLGLGILEERAGAGAGERERLRSVQEDVVQMSNLVDELLSFSRAEVGSGRAAIIDTDVESLVHRVVRREGSEGPRVEVSVDPGLHVLVDPDLLARALGNLLRNALRYAGDFGPIRIEARRRAGKAVIEVLDSGPGVPEDALEHLFEAFYRPEVERSRHTGGTGLGLAIVKAAVTACRGTVKARNLEPRGFAASIVLDLSPARSA